MSKDSLKPKQESKTEDAFLELPVAPPWFSTPPEMSYAEMIKSCERQLPYWNERREKLLNSEPGPSPEPFFL